MDYVRVCLGVLPILLALCHPAHGACRCRDQSECDLPKKYCEAGCETGFTGSRCQYVNQLAYASCKVHQDVVDENLSTCTSQGYTGYITCSIEGPPREFNIIRIFHEPSKSLPSFYIATRGEWEQVSIHKNVTNKITDYEYKGKRLNSSLILHPKFRVCEVAVAYECLHDDECNMECNCKNASDCLGNPRRCPSGCAVGYTGKNYGCEKIEVTPASTLEHETSTAGETTSPPVEPTNACSSGYYRDGQACTPCGAGCTSPCNAANGNCTCKLGWTGNSCNNCEDGYYMDKRDSYMDRRDCVECGAGCESGTCEDETGHCSCRSGWKVPRCATRCVRYRYGIDCKQTCSYGCNSRECNSSTGECLTRSCKPGWRSTDSRRRCDQECPDGSFGVNCDSKCSAGCRVSSCNRKTGRCSCKHGWTPGSSNRCDRCARDKYGIDCQQTCSSGCKSGGCNSSTGECLGGSCKPGWMNTDSLQRCDQECPDGSHGVNCVSTCSPGCLVSPCDRITGRCKYDGGYCKRGWTSWYSHPYRCDRCNGGYYGDGQDCTQCGAGCNGVCDGNDGHCKCKTGWTGTRCNKCEDGYYMDRRDCVECGAGCEPGTCNANNGLCTCVSGWKGPRCATRCDVGTYGPGCTGKCNAGCKPGSCNHVTVDCKCKDGWRGPRCEHICPEETYGRDCTGECNAGCKPLSCHHITGDCNNQCEDGWTGPSCEHKCIDGTYGLYCTEECNTGCKPWSCNHITGDCNNQCEDGWTGRRCEHKCIDGTYGRNCTGECNEGCKPGSCRHDTGDCNSQCKDGWTGASCEHKCIDGTYGLDCTEECNTGCKRWSCNHITGDCNNQCEDGWTGRRCEHKCIDGTYGRNCTGECNEGCKPGSCRHDTGDCNSQCKDGWTGASCEHKCIDGTYGLYCTEECNTGCKPWSCNHITGDCNNQCEDGWTGRRCEHKCIDGTYGRNCTGECNEGCKPGSCRHDTGDCNSQCKDGWTGASCEHKCGKGQYGSGCRKPCRRECLSCHHVTGSCASNCVSGWHGENCTSRCRSGIYGQDCRYQCHEGCQPEKCDSINGSCGTSCRAGWTGENCVDVCSPGAHGENCVLNCSRGCVNQTCDRTTGRCDMCLDGWEHKDQNTSRCDKECDDGMFGEQCNDECSIHCVNATCHHVNGSCTHGCFDGRSGEYCEVSEAGHQNVNLIVGLVLFLIAVIAVAMCAVVYFREPLRRLRGKKTGEDMTNGLSFPMAAREGQGASENGAVYDDDEAIYINVPSSVPVAVSDLKDFVAKKKATKEILVKEYAELPKGLTAIHDKALTQVNSPKNRFKGIYPYNPSLVVLKGPSGSSGYINASFIDGPTRGKKYIATQGPLPHTVVDFLEMIWQQNVPVIVMLANIIEDGRRRCEPYWPNEPGEDSKTFGPWKITVADSCPLADFTIRTLKMRKGAVEKTVKHVHYMVWPDKDVPDNTMSLVDLRNKVRTFCDFAEGPMVVHCSAGVGRTGTLIALDSLIEDAETRSKVDIYGCVWRLRNFRVSMVQTQSQYVFLHDCILDALCHTVHPTPASFYDNAYKQLKGGSGIAVAYQKLSECPVTDHLSDAARDLENINKNRSEDILPGDKHRAILSTHIAGGNDYINAVIAPSYEKREAFILTQIPLTSTVVDFWRLVHDYDIRGIVLLENYTDLDAKCGVFWAKNNKPTKFGPFNVGEGKTEKQTGFTTEKISYSLGTEEKDVTVFRSSAWPQKSSLPESPSSLLSLIDFLRQWNTGTSPLLVVCRDGATRSGLFCVVASAVQRLLLEKEVALPQTIRIIRFVRKQVIPNREQFEFCFDSVKVYMDSFQEYSNFA
ncbi:neurogenic locus Notch protein-like isoform X2 [Haliotis rufescens]|uniref:neurogenic locus Notch protein-like isoform X2 n=1 Tax=Haliotis rufescens TaxID=6454 RepID=UPI00201F0F4D|nr:neurogenic locus Notch protein-like isoform X2 [Haliotis rufescens]